MGTDEKHAEESAEFSSPRCLVHYGPAHKENVDGSWTCPDSTETLETAGLFPIEEYIRRRKATVTNNAKNRYVYR
jgi:hypothetical protein